MMSSLKKLFSHLSIGLCFFATGALPLSAEEYTIKQMTDNQYNDSAFGTTAPFIDNGQIVWIAQVAAPVDGAVFLYDGDKIHQLTDPSFPAYHHQIHEGRVVWSQAVSPSREIFLYDGGQILRLTDDYVYFDTAPDIYNGKVAWIRSRTLPDNMGVVWEISVYDGLQTKQIFSSSLPISDLELHNDQIVWYGHSGVNRLQVFFYDGSQVAQLTHSGWKLFNLSPRIHNGQITWYGYDGHDYEIFLYKGGQIIQLTENNYDDLAPKIHNGQVVWYAYDGSDYEIFLYDGVKITPITNNAFDDMLPKVHNGQIAWSGWDGHDYEIFLYDGDQIKQLSNNEFNDYNPDIDNGRIAWRGYDGHDYEIYLATPGVTKIPLGGRLEVAEEAGNLYRIYVPSRWGGKLTVETDNGLVELYYPDTSTKIAGPDTALTYSIPFEDAQGNAVDNHGWYYVKHTGYTPYVISNTFIEEGEADYRPWNFWYWPFKKQDNPVKNLYGAGGALEKYDAVFETKAGEFEEKNFGGDQWQGWEGHCWGASVASILLPQPQAAAYGGQYFNQEEIEGLAAKLANTENVLGVDLAMNIPSLKPQPGVDDADKFVDDFHIGLVNCLRLLKQRKPLQSNLRDPRGQDPSAVWNHVIYKYSSAMEESEEGNENIIKITTTIYANDDRFPSDDNTIDRIETYVYKLRYKLNGEIVEKFIGKEQDWISATGFTPGNLSYITGCLFDNTYTNNPDITKERAEKLGIDFP